MRSVLVTTLLLSAASFLSHRVLANDEGSDVEAVGKRDINKHQINFISLHKEIAIGKQLAAEVENNYLRD